MVRILGRGRATRTLVLSGLIVVLGALAEPPVSTRGGSFAAPNAHDKEPLTFAKDVEPILSRRCHQCHTAALKTKGGLDMTTYKSFMKGGQRGKPVEPGKSAESVLFKLVSKDEKPHMPPATEEPISIEEILLIKDWIDQGAKP
jgi:uncharacterized membrane protein